MAAKKTQNAGLQSLADFRATTNAGGNNRAGFLKPGRTVLFPIGPAPAALFATVVTDQFNGKPQDKVAFYAYVVKAKDASGLPKEYGERIIPLVVPKTVFNKIADRILAVDDEEMAPATLTVMNDDGTVSHLGTAFLVDRTGSGLNTDYGIVAIEEARTPEFPDSVNMPEEDLDAFAAQYNEWQLNKDNAPAAESESDDVTNALDDVF